MSRTVSYDAELEFDSLFPAEKIQLISKEKEDPYIKAKDKCFASISSDECSSEDPCELMRCQADACGTTPKQECFNEDSRIKYCQKRTRWRDEFINDPTPKGLGEIPPYDSPEWNRANSGNLTIDDGFKSDIS